MKNMIAVVSWEIGEPGDRPSVVICKDLKDAREELDNDAFEPEHTNDDDCLLGPKQLKLGVERQPEHEIECERCRIDGWDPEDGEFFLFPNAGRGDMQVCAFTVEVPS